MMTFVSKDQSQGLIILGWYLPASTHARFYKELEIIAEVSPVAHLYVSLIYDQDTFAWLATNNLSQVVDRLAAS